MMRTHTCGELSLKDVGNVVKLTGWVHSTRDHGGVIFIDLRDRYGLTQLVFNPEKNKEIHRIAESLRREDVVMIKGAVSARDKDLINNKIATGEIEVFVDEIKVINKAQTPPLEIDDRIEASEEVRMKYRYLDLRRPIMQQRFRFRYLANRTIREFLHKNNFTEIETPMLVRSTPEGARDYVVPSRVHPGKFYALPQSPQLYKQLLMIAGFDRYFQFARCLRDEDLRADRQPEHTQVDLEMSFVSAQDIRDLIENLVKHLFKETLNIELPDFNVLTYDESMEKYGIDKPDLRFGLELCDVTDIMKESEFKVFKDVIANKGIIKCINPKHNFSRNDIDDLINFSIKQGAKGMAWMKVTEQGLESNIVKYFPEEVQRKILDRTKAKPGSVLMFIADKPKTTNHVLAVLRNELGKRLNLYNKKEFRFAWIVDFPLFEWNEDEQKWDAAHHIFSMPKEDSIEFIDKDPAKVYGDLFDLVLNGIELGSGSIRVSNPEIQQRLMKVIGITKEEAEEKFGFLLEAYKYGGPVHGGMGLGFDRLLALMLGMNDIREVITFPKNKAAASLLDGSPSPITKEQLKELHINIDLVKK